MSHYAVNTHSLEHTQSRVFAAILEGTIIGPVLEVQIVKNLDQHGLEIASPSTLKHETTSYVVIARGTERFVDEIHDPKSNSDQAQNCSLHFRKTKERESLEESKNSIKETCPLHVACRYGNKKACANNLSSLPSVFFLKQTTIRTNERKWIVIDVNPPHGGALSIHVSKLVTRRVRHHDQDEREQDGSHHWDTVRSLLLKVFAKYGAQKFSERNWIQLIQEAVRKEFNTVCITKMCWLTFIKECITTVIGNVIRMPFIG